MKYKAFGFDWSGVIFGQPGSYFSKGASEILGVTSEEFQKTYFKHNSIINLGNNSFNRFWETVASELGKKEKLNDLINFIKNQPKREINQNVVDIIKALKNKKYKLGLLSNNTTEEGQKIKDSFAAKYFDVILISADIGYMKPQKQAFEMLAEKLGVRLSELVFIDDAEHSLRGSKEIGYHPVIYTDCKNLRQQLIKLGALNK